METVGSDLSLKKFSGEEGGRQITEAALGSGKCCCDGSRLRCWNAEGKSTRSHEHNGRTLTQVDREGGACPPALRRSSWTLRKSAPALLIYLPLNHEETQAQKAK